MQSYTEIPSSQSLQSSLALLLNNDKTSLSNSSGTAFPTSNLQVGMLCFRTDQNKLYILKDVTPTWSLIWDFNAPAVTQGADIGGGADLNTYTATGWYHQNTNANATGGTNYPAAKAGLLNVHADGSMVYQSYQTYDSAADLYFRSSYNGTWSSWRKVITLDNDGAGSGLDADLLDGMQSGNANGNIPISNGTVNTNLNADMVDGKHAGNASGNVPVSNGTLNTDLNADMLDGYHASSFVRTIQGVAPDASGNVVVDLASKVSKSGDTMTGDLIAPRFISNVAAGTAPFDCTSTTVVANLNADLLDGYHYNNLPYAPGNASNYVSTNLSYGGVGTIMICVKHTAVNVSNNATTAGSNISPTMVMGQHESAFLSFVKRANTLSGTWKNISGYTIDINNTAGLFQRIA